MKIKFSVYPRKGNNSGCGFFYLPENKFRYFIAGDEIKVKIDDEIEFFAKVACANRKFGVYIPKSIFLENKLVNRMMNISIENIRGFHSRVGKDGRIYVPNNLANRMGLNNKEIVCVTAYNGLVQVIKKYSKINMRKKVSTIEYMCAFDSKYYGKKFIFTLEKLDNKKMNVKIDQIIKNMKYSYIDKNSLILFSRQKNPIIINRDLEPSGIALYLGAYFADGTKIGNSWAICASTIEQAKFYLKIHNLLIKNSQPEFTISYTTKNNNEKQIKNEIRNRWLDAGIEIGKFRIRKPIGKFYGKTNENGTLIIREHKQCLLDFYNALLKYYIDKIISKNKKSLALDFFCGILEGDGSVGSKSGHIIVTTNKNEFTLLKKILIVSGLKHKPTIEKSGKYYIRIGALEIIRNFDLLKDKLFVYYPKRRRLLFERLQNVGAVKFILGGKHTPTSWVKSWLAENGFVDSDYKLTKKGMKLRKDLLNSMKSAELAQTIRKG